MKFEKAPYPPPRGKYQPRPAWLIAVAIVTIIGLSQCPSTSFIEDTYRQSLEQILLSVPSSEHARNWSHYYTTTGSHLPGQGLRQAEWTKAKWLEFGMTHVRIASYDTPLPTPTGQQRLVLLLSSESESSLQEIIYKAPLTDTNSSSGFVPAYYGFSANANITASYVFANFGSADDYQDLEQRGVAVDDKIVIIKSATQASSRLKHPSSPDVFRGVQIANAEARGAAGVLIYVDPQIDGGMTEGNGHRPFPDGLARPLTGIERGTLGSLEDFLEGSVPQIPAMPISTANAIVLLRALNAHGPPAHELGSRWRGGALGFYGVGYNVGLSPPDLSLHLISQASLQDGTVHNVIATIQGTVSDEVVILGNHRDAWGPGAGDPGSGSAALNEVVRSFGVALKTGWRPYRTIILASWGGGARNIGRRLPQCGGGSRRQRGPRQGQPAAVPSDTHGCAGPVVGGFLTQSLGWQWAFWFVCPICVVAVAYLVAVWLVSPSSSAAVVSSNRDDDYRRDTWRKLKLVDWAGACPSFLGIALLLISTSQGGSAVAWTSPQTLTMKLTGGLLLILFLVIELRWAALPLLPARIFQYTRSTNVLIAANICIGWIFWGNLFVLPLYLQVVRGASPAEAGILMLPMVVVHGLTSAGTGFAISRLGRYKPVILASAVCWALAAVGKVHFDMDTPVWKIVVVGVFDGIGVGCSLQPVSGAILINMLFKQLKSRFSPDLIAKLTSSAFALKDLGLGAGERMVIVEAYMHGLRAIFASFAVIIAIHLCACASLRDFGLKGAARKQQELVDED